MDVIRACTDSSENGNDILVVFRISPEKKNFKIILSMRVFYTLYKGTEIADIIKENEKNINFITFGNDIETVNPLLFDFMKEKVNIKKVKDNVIFLAMIFNKITKEKITRMAITYGLWEGQKGDIRNEMKYTFEVEPVNNGYIHSIYNQTEKNIKK